MKKYLIALGLSAALSGFANAGEIYNLEPTHSYVEFHYNHMGYSNPSGKWYANGSINFESKDIAKSSANITITVGDIVTGIPKLDEHLKSGMFFDVKKYPTAKFIGDKVTNIKGKQFDLGGQLTVHGVTKPVTLHVTQNTLAPNPMNDIQSAGFSATATIKRSDFGIANYVPAVSDEINLNIEIEAQLAAAKK
ncbi:MAG: YceI family protein [Burkholderiales bacterium]|jgi:polyisoprenoid-binding protein YceI|nr:YceI family protein [Burkholderiales bacterium]